MDINKRLAALEKQSKQTNTLSAIERIQLIQLLMMDEYSFAEDWELEGIKQEIENFKKRLGEKGFQKFLEDQQKIEKESKTKTLSSRYITKRLVKKIEGIQPFNQESGEETKERLGL